MSSGGPAVREGGAGQFLLGPAGETAVTGWRSYPLRAGLEVSAHPDLPVHTVESAGRQVLMLGYATDPARPGRGDLSVLADVAGRSRCAIDLVRSTDQLVGRYVLVLLGDDERVALGDAAGARQVHHARPGGGGPVWLASTARLLGERLRLPGDQAAELYEASQDFIGIRGGSWWPGDRTRYRGCSRLLPNFVLDLRTGVPHRCFPSSPGPRASLEEARAHLVTDVRGAITAMAARGPLTLLVTAGADSRLLLAGARPVAKDLTLVSLRNPEGQEDDVEVPARFCADLGLRHTVVTARPPGEEFLRTYREQDGPANAGYAANAAALLPVTSGRTAITGHVAGVVKRAFGGARFARTATPSRLAMESQMGRNTFAVDAWSAWLSSVPASRYRTHDLAYWENRVGSWAAGWALEYDLVWQDVLWPLASRRLLRSLLQAPDRNGQRAQQALWSDTTQSWWPELARYPLGGNRATRPGLRARVRRSVEYAAART